MAFDLEGNYDPPPNPSIVTSIGRGQYGDVQIWTLKQMFTGNHLLPEKVAVKETFRRAIKRIEGQCCQMV